MGAAAHGCPLARRDRRRRRRRRAAAHIRHPGSLPPRPWQRERDPSRARKGPGGTSRRRRESRRRRAGQHKSPPATEWPSRTDRHRRPPRSAATMPQEEAGGAREGLRPRPPAAAPRTRGLGRRRGRALAGRVRRALQRGTAARKDRQAPVSARARRPPSRQRLTPAQQSKRRRTRTPPGAAARPRPLPPPSSGFAAPPRRQACPGRRPRLRAAPTWRPVRDSARRARGCPLAPGLDAAAAGRGRRRRGSRPTTGPATEPRGVR